ncbi:tripartite motif-containing protein 60-like [Sorex fumeus]|uniref:tripartite motif-containing protein 60-like n=1 Tax=Sorex fumeus TaxID=62283 RepID=UPI0024ADA0C7|nr:tripartite motif-containing protein 60-like [Sorex fumeus]
MALAELQAQARCPLCQGPLRAPLTLDCGHNCCGSCLRLRWQHLREPLPCPVCQQRCPRKLRGPNMQLALLDDLVSQLPGSRPEGHAPEAPGHCAEHQQALSLFCDDHLELLCGQCAASAAHRGHRLTPIGPAAAHHRTKLKCYLEPLRKQLQEAQGDLEKLVSKRQKLKEKLVNQRSDLYFESEHLKCHLKNEQEAMESNAHEEMELITRSLMSFQGQLSDYGSTLNNLLREATEHFLQRDLDLLQGADKVQLLASRCESLKLPELLERQISKQVPTLPPCYIGLQNMISKFQVDLTLDPDTAHPSLTISPDRRTALYNSGIGKRPSVPHPRAFTSHLAVLGSQGFDAGRHFWQVKIQGSGVWSLGVCKESFPRKNLIKQNVSKDCWKFRQPTYHTLEHQSSSSHIGVFLDFELGQVSFYNLNTRSHLYTLTDTFKEKLWPYFFASPTSMNFSMNLVQEES